MTSRNPYTITELKCLHTMFTKAQMQGAVHTWLSYKLGYTRKPVDDLRIFPVDVVTRTIRTPTYRDMLFELPLSDVPLYVFPESERNGGDVSLSIIAKWRLSIGK